MRDYFTIHKINEHIYHVEEKLGVYVTVIVGNESAILFDTGHGLFDLDEMVRTITDLPYQVIVGHGHFDHASGNYQFEKVYIHEKDIALCQLHTDESRRKLILLDCQKRQVDITGVDTEAFLHLGAGNLIPIDMNKEIDLGGLTIQVIEMPGHTNGSIGLLVKEDKFLLTSDSSNPFVWNFLEESTTLSVYEAMLKRVKQLPFDQFLTGHSSTVFPKRLYDYFIQVTTDATIENSSPIAIELFPEIEVYIHTIPSDIKGAEQVSVLFSKAQLK